MAVVDKVHDSACRSSSGVGVRLEVGEIIRWDLGAKVGPQRFKGRLVFSKTTCSSCLLDTCDGFLLLLHNLAFGEVSELNGSV